MLPTYKNTNYPVVLFDSQCLICDGFVQWIIQKDKKRILHFSGLQSRKAQGEITQRHISMAENGSVVLLLQERYYTESDAIIHIMKMIGMSSLLIRIADIVPKSWRDSIYRGVARNRYRFYKKRDHCPLPDPSEADRFV